MIPHIRLQLLNKTSPYFKNNQAEEKGTVIQFERCPWCESTFGEALWEIGDLTPTSIERRCQDETCLFHDGVPFTCVDDDIYINPLGSFGDCG